MFGLAEVDTKLDSFRGRTRASDLVVIGNARVGRVVLDVEGKADEPFGKRVREELAAPKAGSNIPARIGRLARALLPGVQNDALGSLRYQLLYGVGATLIRASVERAAAAVFVIHEFRSDATDPEKHRTNAEDLRSFACELARATAFTGTTDIPSGGGVVGPFRCPGLVEPRQPVIPANIALYIAKVSQPVPA
jgi:hypothetical protein